MKSRRMLLLVASVAAVIGLAALVSACGGNDDSDQARQTDDDFMAQMVDHHEMAIDMAEMAQEQGEHAEVKELADAIVDAQSGEIDQMNSIHQRMFDEPMAAHEHGTLGMSVAELGMNMDMAALERAKPFDEAFIDSMIPHHQGAIRMARIEHEQGQDGEVRALAAAIIAAQSREIGQMNAWRKKWFGAASPAGGVPEEGEPVPSHGAMGH